MKVGVIGIGNIAQEAYLPVMAGIALNDIETSEKIAQNAYLPIRAEMRDTVEWHICSRNKETLEQVGKKYDFKDVNAVK